MSPETSPEVLPSEAPFPPTEILSGQAVTSRDSGLSERLEERKQAAARLDECETSAKNGSIGWKTGHIGSVGCW